MLTQRDFVQQGRGTVLHIQPVLQALCQRRALFILSLFYFKAHVFCAVQKEMFSNAPSRTSINP